jgi:hypothetical protein
MKSDGEDTIETRHETIIGADRVWKVPEMTKDVCVALIRDSEDDNPMICVFQASISMAHFIHLILT